MRRLVRLAKCRWKIEQDYQQLKEELGLDHYEGRSWIGWHHHTTLVMLAHAFLTLEMLRSKKKLLVGPCHGRDLRFNTCSSREPASAPTPWRSHRLPHAPKSLTSQYS